MKIYFLFNKLETNREVISVILFKQLIQFKVMAAILIPEKYNINSRWNI